LRQNPAAQRYVARLAQQHGKPKALTILAHKLARAVYYMRHRQQAFEAARFFPVNDHLAAADFDAEVREVARSAKPCRRRRAQRRGHATPITSPAEAVMTAVPTH
jgi:hypothetical protein